MWGFSTYNDPSHNRRGKLNIEKDTTMNDVIHDDKPIEPESEPAVDAVVMSEHRTLSGKKCIIPHRIKTLIGTKRRVLNVQKWKQYGSDPARENEFYEVAEIVWGRILGGRPLPGGDIVVNVIFESGEKSNDHLYGYTKRV